MSLLVSLSVSLFVSLFVSLLVSLFVFLVTSLLVSLCFRCRPTMLWGLNGQSPPPGRTHMLLLRKRLICVSLLVSLFRVPFRLPFNYMFVSLFASPFGFQFRLPFRCFRSSPCFGSQGFEAKAASRQPCPKHMFLKGNLQYKSVICCVSLLVSLFVCLSVPLFVSLFASLCSSVFDSLFGPQRFEIKAASRPHRLKTNVL